MKASVIILTFNSEHIIEKTLESAQKVSDDVLVVDSFSSDRTIEILKSQKVKFFQRNFLNYGDQRNWAISSLPVKYEWQLHLDADERPSKELTKEIIDLNEADLSDLNGFFLPRLVLFMGKKIQHGGMYPIWHMRLFRSNFGKCEERKYDQHFFVSGKTSKLSSPMLDDMSFMTIDEWTNRHNKWANAEVEEILGENEQGRIKARLTGGNPVEQKRYFRKIYSKCPLFLRAFLFFFYRYFILLGFLDGIPGLIFFFLQTCWFRFLVDAKLFEKTSSKEVQF